MQAFLKTSVNGEKNITIDMKLVLGKGAQATVYVCKLGSRKFAAKIFHQRSHFNDKKIEAMIANPPEMLEDFTAGILYPRYSWPLSIILDSQNSPIGYLMPLIDQTESFTLDHYYDKNLGQKLNSPDEVALSYKIEIAANLSSLVADLHGHGHFFIDFKPQNIRVFKRTHAVTLIDCDGFSIQSQDGKRYPAELISTDYISPEAFRNKSVAKDLDINQDRYALATIIFQLLNGGIHPFQGIQTDTLHAPTNDEKAALGLYPHGLAKDTRIIPRPQSVHLCFDDVSRGLFDRAFIGNPDSRPSSEEWSEHLTLILKNKQLTRCEKNPYDIRHMRFLNKECPECAFQIAKSKNNEKRPKARIDFDKLNQKIKKTPTQSAKKKNLPLSIVMIILVGILAYGVISIFKDEVLNSSDKDINISEQYKLILTDKYLDKLKKIESIPLNSQAKFKDGVTVSERARKYVDLGWQIMEAKDAAYYPLAFKLNTQAYELKHPEGASNLGYMYEFGMGVKQDYQKAAQWYRKTIEMGQPHSAQAELQLGKLIAENKIPSSNRVREARLYFEAGIEVANNSSWPAQKDMFLREFGVALNNLNQKRDESSNQASTKKKLEIKDLSSDEIISLESTCNQDRTLGGEKAYVSCLERNLKLLEIGPRVPSLSKLSADKKASIEAVCSQDKFLRGPAAYAKCVKNQLDTMR
jgi:serine/threonine protein kinase